MEQSFDLSDVLVQIGIPVAGTFHPLHAMCQARTAYCLSQHNLAFDLKYQYGCSIVEQARNFVADNFLASECTHLFMIDSDITWTEKDFIRLLALATKMECVAAIYPVKREPETWMLSTRGKRTVNEYGCLPIDGIGLGFCCVQRKVIQGLALKAQKVRFPDRDHPVPRIFSCDVNEGHFRGEDIHFCADVKSLGYDVWLDPAIELGHIGSKEYRGSFLEAMKDKKVVNG